MILWAHLEWLSAPISDAELDTWLPSHNRQLTGCKHKLLFNEYLIPSSACSDFVLQHILILWWLNHARWRAPQSSGYSVAIYIPYVNHEEVCQSSCTAVFKVPFHWTGWFNLNNEPARARQGNCILVPNRCWGDLASSLAHLQPCSGVIHMICRAINAALCCQEWLVLLECIRFLPWQINHDYLHPSEQDAFISIMSSALCLMELPPGSIWMETSKSTHDIVTHPLPFTCTCVNAALLRWVVGGQVPICWLAMKSQVQL